MSKITRRKFLRVTAAGGAAAVLGSKVTGCVGTGSDPPKTREEILKGLDLRGINKEVAKIIPSDFVDYATGRPLSKDCPIVPDKEHPGILFYVNGVPFTADIRPPADGCLRSWGNQVAVWYHLEDSGATCMGNYYVKGTKTNEFGLQEAYCTTQDCFRHQAQMTTKIEQFKKLTKEEQQKRIEAAKAAARRERAYRERYKATLSPKKSIHEK